MIVVQGEIQDYLSPEDYIIQIWTTKDDVTIAELIKKVILCLILYLILNMLEILRSLIS